MIEFTRAFKASDGKAYFSIEEAQEAEIKALLQRGDGAMGATWTIDEVASYVVASKSSVIDILTTSESSRPRARKVNGGRKSRKPSVVPNEETKAA